MAVLETIPLSLFLMLAESVYSSRLCIFIQGREEGKGAPMFYQENKHFQKCHEHSEGWPEWGHRALLPAKEAGKVGNRIVMS